MGHVCCGLQYVDILPTYPTENTTMTQVRPTLVLCRFGCWPWLTHCAWWMLQYGFWLHSVDGVSIDGRNITVCETVRCRVLLHVWKVLAVVCDMGDGYLFQNSCIGFVDTGGPLLNVPLQVAAALIPYVHINANCSG